MKVSLPKNDGNFSKKKEEPPLPLVDDDFVETDKLKLAKFKLRTDPRHADPTYDFHMVKINGSESLRHGIRFMTDILKVFTGLNITDADAAMRIYRELLSGEALSQFNGTAQKELDRPMRSYRIRLDQMVTTGWNGLG